MCWWIKKKKHIESELVWDRKLSYQIRRFVFDDNKIWKLIVATCLTLFFQKNTRFHRTRNKAVFIFPFLQVTTNCLVCNRALRVFNDFHFWALLVSLKFNEQWQKSATQKKFVVNSDLLNNWKHSREFFWSNANKAGVEEQLRQVNKKALLQVVNISLRVHGFWPTKIFERATLHSVHSYTFECNIFWKATREYNCYISWQLLLKASGVL